MSDVTIRLEYREAKKLLAALEKGVYNKLTPGQADAISEFCFEFRCSVEEAAMRKADSREESRELHHVRSYIYGNYILHNF